MKNKGFTLIELMIAIAIAGIVASIVLSPDGGCECKRNKQSASESHISEPAEIR